MGLLYQVNLNSNGLSLTILNWLRVGTDNENIISKSIYKNVKFKERNGILTRICFQLHDFTNIKLGKETLRHSAHHFPLFLLIIFNLGPFKNIILFGFFHYL